MNSEKIKYLAYKELGFSPCEHKYFDELLEQIVKVRGLSEEDNPIHKSKNYENVEALIGNINNFLQKYALRAGERIDIKPPEMTEENILAFEKIFYHLQMRKEKKTQYKNYNAVLCMGAAENAVRSRMKRLGDVITNEGVSIENIMVLGAERKLWPLKKDGDSRSFPEPILYDILARRLTQRDGKTVLPEEVKEYILNLEIKENAVEKIAEEVAADKYFSSIKWPTETDLICEVIKQNPVFDAQKIIVVNTPDFPDGKRADSARTIKYAYKENSDIFVAGAKILQISSQPFTRNQKRVAELNLPSNVEIDVIGEGIDEGKSFEARKKDVMIGMDSMARTIYASYGKIKENILSKNMIGNEYRR